MKRHCCKVCGHSFPSGRSLGGHMRSHVLLSSSWVNKENSMCKYGLRENPRKSWRFEEKEVNKLCTPSSSRSSQFEIKRRIYKMRRNDLSEEEDEKKEDLESNGSYDEEEDEMQSQSDSEVTAVAVPVRRQRTMPDSSPEYEEEQKMGAFCLLMLSRGAGSAIDSSDKIAVVVEDERSNPGSPRFDFEINELEQVQSFPLESVFSQEFNTTKPSTLDSDGLHLGKRTRYECKTCNKSFHSYQALGGHRANHKKIKDASFSKIHASKSVENLFKKSTDHECSICGKVFASGQSLGGHKRSHMITANNAASVSSSVRASPVVIEIDQKNYKLNSLDLNLPAPDDEGLDNPNGSIEYWN